MELEGRGVSAGFAVGTVRLVRHTIDRVEKRPGEPKTELARFEAARMAAAVQLGELAVTTAKKLGEENSLLFQIHQMMLEDLDYREAVRARIDDGVCAEYAVSETARSFAQDFASMDDAYMQARAADVLDVSRRVVELLLGVKPQESRAEGPEILAAADFAPSETAQMDPGKVLALVTAGGAANSHTAIFARTMGIPAVIGLGRALDDSWDGKLCVVDGGTGRIILDPTPEQLASARGAAEAGREQADELAGWKDRETRAKNGRRILLCANIGCVRDAELALGHGAEGVGLFRSEFLYLGRSDYPDEQTQFEAYRAVAETMGERPVVIRTLDIGADKQADYFELAKEDNPAMGLRALRICLRRPEIFKTQLRAIYRASVCGNLLVMFPMVASLWELRRAKELAAEARAELAARNIPFRADVPLGIMVETPAAAVMSDELAAEAAFFSIGTNDLTQYTLAADRQNEALGEFCNPRHEAVLRLIETTVKNAHAHGIWAGICGELAADKTLTERFVQMGVDELSVVPPAILPLRKAICEG
jgi:phosphotransferase system enzyme I (PtsI)